MTSSLSIEYVALDTIAPSPDNPRRHPPGQIRQLCENIAKLGFINPIVIDLNGTIVAGHARYQAAGKLGLSKVPIIRVTHLNETELRAYRLADNKLTENAMWDPELLRVEISYLVDVGFATDLTGFSPTEIDLIMAPMPETALADPAPEDAQNIQIPVSQPGDCFALGLHRILCGDVFKPDEVQALMSGARADMGFCDPPYNVPIAGHVSGLGKLTHGEFSMASGEMTGAEFQAFLEVTLRNLAQASRGGAVHYVCMDWRHLAELYAATELVYDEQLNLVVWSKTNAGMGSLYRSQHELIGVYRVGTTPHQNNVELGKNGRYRTNVWTYPGQNAFGSGRDESLGWHPTVKPVQLVADAIMDVTSRGHIVLDGFLGSGTTLIAAEQIGRTAYGMEIDARYVDIAIRRWQNLTGDRAVHVETGTTFPELAVARQCPEAEAET